MHSGEPIGTTAPRQATLDLFNAGSALGWQEESWSGHREAPISTLQSWEELGPAEQAAAIHGLGFSEDEWDTLLHSEDALVSVDSSAQLGWLWLLSRLIYPVCFAQGIPILFVSTLPGYFFIAMLWQPIVTLALK